MAPENAFERPVRPSSERAVPGPLNADVGCHLKECARFDRSFKFAAYLLAAALAIGPCTGNGQTVPTSEGHVTDLANVLAPAQRAALESKLDAFERETTHQIAVLTVPSLKGQSLEEFSLRTANAWKLGSAADDNGILVTLALSEHQVRIELGFGIEQYISDGEAQLIINEAMIPLFREDNYFGGIDAGLQRLMVAARRFEVSSARSDDK